MDAEPFAHVVYACDLHAWEPSGLALTDLTQDNPLLDAHRTVLAAEFPRRRFETELRVIVGELRADTGSYWTGPERKDGLAKLAALQDERKLGLAGGCYLITKVFDRDVRNRNEGSFVSVRASFGRPKRPEQTANSSVSVQVEFDGLIWPRGDGLIWPHLAGDVIGC